MKYLDMNKNYPYWLVSVGQAKKLKKIGFDEPCEFFLPIKQYEDFDTNELEFEFQKENYNDSYDYWSIPTHEQVLKWFREKEIVGTIKYLPILGKKIYIYVIDAPFFSCEEEFLSYEEAREALVNRLIKEYTEYEQAKKEWQENPCYQCCQDN